jgi:hypothetical protein
MMNLMGVIAMAIDIERLKTDRDYWDEVAPKGAGFYGEEDYEWEEAWYKKQDDTWYLHSSFQGWTNISNGGSVFDDFIHNRAGSLINRPETQTTQWRGKQDGLPPVGTECEAYEGGLAWREVKIIAHDEDCAMYRVRKGLWKGGLANIFRPIKTEREKTIEAAIAELSTLNSCMADHHKVLGTLYDAGMLKQAGDADD